MHCAAVQWGAATCSSRKRYHAKRRCARCSRSPSLACISSMLLSETNTTQQDCSNPIKSHGLDLTCQHKAAGCWMLLKAVGSVYGDVKRAHGLLHGSWIARIARTARSCTDLHGVARTARRARRARTAQTARTARTARTLHGLHGPHGQHGLQGERVQLTPSPHYWV